MYADDSTITGSSSNINEIENNLNTALGRIYDWCVRNKLTINANKTKSMLIGSKQKVCNTDLKAKKNPIVSGLRARHFKTSVSMFFKIKFKK